MPRGDGTGPMGQGPFTGRGLGNCITYGIPALAGAAAFFGFGRRGGFGRGFGRALGRGFGFGRGFGAGFAQSFGWNVPTKDDELNALKEEARAIQERITELEKE